MAGIRDERIRAEREFDSIGRAVAIEVEGPNDIDIGGGLKFGRTDVGRADDGKTALVGGRGGNRAGIDGRRTREKEHRRGRTAIVAEGSEQGMGVARDVAVGRERAGGVAAADQVAVEAGEGVRRAGIIDITAAVSGDDGVFHDGFGCVIIVTIDAPTKARGGAVAGEGAAGEGHKAALVINGSSVTP